ncbi:hypothetical protein [Nitratireductor sp. GCM10026969]|uniref:hypothetical protein n=1 Tax=Nitratireductor sp. GCM10026969 TaxID=3252645 RepID=UPI00360DC0CB
MKRSLSLLEDNPLPIRKAIRRARWFVSSFRDFVDAVGEETQQDFTLDEAKLISAFTSWYRAFESQKDKAQDHRLEYVTFAAGLMLRELIRFAPLSAATQSREDPDEPAHFWPEGYVYLSFCLAVRAAVIEQDFSIASDIAPELGDIRTWWSFRENTFEDRNLAIAFLELFAGETPNWTTPGIFLSDDGPKLPPASPPPRMKSHR